MQGEPAEPSFRPEDDFEEDPEAVAARLRRQMTRLRRWFAWELWLLEPRSFAPPDDDPDDPDASAEAGRDH